MFLDIFPTRNVDKLSCTGMGIGVESLHSDCYNIVIVVGTIFNAGGINGLCESVLFEP